MSGGIGRAGLKAAACMRLAWLAPAALAFLAAAAPPLAFAPAGPRFEAAADQYRALWEAEGARMAAALEAASGLRFPDLPIEAIVSETAPMTSFDGRSMRLRASYSPAYKRATLVHELGHRLAFTLPGAAGLDDHRLLYLFLYDAWAELYGRAFADRMVSIERRIGPAYADAWDWALAMSGEERQARLRALRAQLDYEPLDLDWAATRPGGARRPRAAPRRRSGRD